MNVAELKYTVILAFFFKMLSDMICQEYRILLKTNPFFNSQNLIHH